MKRLSLGIVAWLSLSVGACVLGPNYHTPDLPSGLAAPLDDSKIAAPASTPVPDQWWHLYNDPELDHLIEEALIANYDLKVAEANLSSSRALLDAARAGRYPTTELEAAGVHGRNATTDEILEIGGHQPKTQWTLDAGFDMAYEVDLFGRIRRSIEASRDNAQAAAAERDDLKITVAAETARAYAQVCTLGEELDVTRHSLKIVSQQAEIEAELRDAGGGTELAVVQEQGLVAQVRASIPSIEGQRHVAFLELTALLGKPPNNAPTEVLACHVAPQLSSAIPVEDGMELLRRRPDVRKADRKAAAATAQIGVAIADLYPRVSLTGFYGGVGTHLHDLTTNNGLMWGIGPSISWNFPIQALPRARVRAAKSNAQAAIDSFDSVVLTALKEAQQAIATYRAELDQHDDLVEAQRKSQTAFDLAQADLQAGSISSFDLLTAEQTLVSANSAVAQSDISLAQDQIALFKALGGGWQSTNDSKSVKECRPSSGQCHE